MKIVSWVKKNCFLLYILPLLLLLLAERIPQYHLADDAVLDTVCQGTELPDPRVCVIGIDEETLEAYGSLEDWGRERLAEMIGLLTEDPEQAPAVIAVDIGIYGNREEESDRRLTEAVKKAGNVVLASSASFGNVIGEEGEDGSFRASAGVLSLEEAFPELEEAAAASGYSNIILDGDGYVRHAPGSLLCQGRRVSSFAFQAAKLYSGDADPAFDAENSLFRISFSGKSGEYYGTQGSGLSFVRVLEGEVPAEAFRGALVLIGVYASGMQDQYYTAAENGRLMQGVEIQANIAAQILSGRYITEPGLALRLLLIFLCTQLAFLLLYRCDLWHETILSILAAGLYVLLVKLVYLRGSLVLPVLSPVLALAGPCLIRMVRQIRSASEEKQKLLEKFSRYMPQSVAQQVAARAAETDTDTENLFPGEKKQIAVMFADIRGYTALTEEMEPEQAAGIISRFLTITTEAIYRQDGTVDKYIGDCTMALFNAPLDLENYCYRAVCAALEIMEKCSHVTVDPSRPELKLQVGIGIDCGDAIVGNVGTAYRMEYTAIGDTVNTASRIEGKADAGEILVSNRIYKAIREHVRCEFRGTAVLKGKSRPIKIWQVVGLVQAED